MSRLLPPTCLLLALLLLIAGFAILAIEKPQPSVELHRVTAAGDEKRREVLEDQLDQQKIKRTGLIVSVFGLAIVLGTVGFISMTPRGRRPA